MRDAAAPSAVIRMALSLIVIPRSPYFFCSLDASIRASAISAFVSFCFAASCWRPFHADFIRFAELVSLFPKRAHLVRKLRGIGSGA